MKKTREPASFLPLTAVAFEILSALAEGAAHGYRVLKKVEEQTEGAVCLRPGTLYRAISRLLEQGLIEEVQDRRSRTSDSRRRCYSLSELGWAVVRAEARRLERSVRVIRGRLVVGKQETP